MNNACLLCQSNFQAIYKAHWIHLTNLHEMNCQLLQIFEKTLPEGRLDWIRISDWMEKFTGLNASFAKQPEFIATDAALQELLKDIPVRQFPCASTMQYSNWCLIRM